MRTQKSRFVPFLLVVNLGEDRRGSLGECNDNRNLAISGRVPQPFLTLVYHSYDIIHYLEQNQPAQSISQDCRIISARESPDFDVIVSSPTLT